MEKVIEFKEQDLVQISIHTLYGWLSVWVRVMFVDADDTFIGRIEKLPRRGIDGEIGQDIRYSNNQVTAIYTDQQLCYSDNVSICNCPGLCRDK